MKELLCIFEEHDVVKCEVINGFAFAVSSDVVWECIGPFKSIGYFVADPIGKKGFRVMV